MYVSIRYGDIRKPSRLTDFDWLVSVIYRHFGEGSCQFDLWAAVRYIIIPRPYPPTLLEIQPRRLLVPVPQGHVANAVFNVHTCFTHTQNTFNRVDASFILIPCKRTKFHKFVMRFWVNKFKLYDWWLRTPRKRTERTPQLSLLVTNFHLCSFFFLENVFISIRRIYLTTQQPVWNLSFGQKYSNNIVTFTDNNQQPFGRSAPFFFFVC